MTAKLMRRATDLSSCCLHVVQVYLQPCRRNSLMKCAPEQKKLQKKT